VNKLRSVTLGLSMLGFELGGGKGRPVRREMIGCLGMPNIGRGATGGGTAAGGIREGEPATSMGKPSKGEPSSVLVW